MTDTESRWLQLTETEVQDHVGEHPDDWQVDYCRKLQRDWRTLVAEIERLNRERESRQSFINCLKTEINDLKRRLEASEVERDTTSTDLHDRLKDSEAELAALKSEREQTVEKVRALHDRWAGIDDAVTNELLSLVLEQHGEPPR